MNRLQISYLMQIAINEAKLAFLNNEVPVGALIASDNKIISKASNNIVTSQDHTAHAEILAIRIACNKLETLFLNNCYIVTTLEPCAMCAHVISKARLKILYFGAYDIKSGGVEHGPQIFKYSHNKPQIFGGILEKQCADLMKNFFKKKRNDKYFNVFT